MTLPASPTQCNISAGVPRTAHRPFPVRSSVPSAAVPAWPSLVLVPDGKQNSHDIRRPGPVRPLPPDRGKHIRAQSRHPLARVPDGTCWTVHGEHRGDRLLERQHQVTPRHPRVPACSGYLAVGQGCVSDLGQRHEANGTDPQRPALAVDEETLDTLLLAGRRNPLREAVLIPEDPLLQDIPHEGDGELTAVSAHLVTLSELKHREVEVVPDVWTADRQS